MSKAEKLLARFLSKPVDFSYDELRTLLKGPGYQEDRSAAGSRVAFVNRERIHVIRLHRPHPINVLKLYQLDQIIAQLEDQEVLP
jgi:hypothetical protein